MSRKNAGLYGGRVFESCHTHLKVLTVVSDSQRSNAKKQRFFRFFRALKVESVQTFKSAKFLSKKCPGKLNFAGIKLVDASYFIVNTCSR